jgi:hypothetical protein
VEQNLQKLFKQSQYKGEEKLSRDIWNVIESKTTHMTKQKTLVYLSIGILSLVGSIFSIKSLIEEFSKLGFFDYFSLIFSDISIIGTYWREYILTLIDSLPITSLIILFFLLFTLFICIRRVSYKFRRKFSII